VWALAELVYAVAVLAVRDDVPSPDAVAALVRVGLLVVERDDETGDDR
jgi:hypothetical protein